MARSRRLSKKGRRRRVLLSQERIILMYEKRAASWGKSFLLANHWRIRSVYDLEDISQDAFLAYMQVCRKNPLKSEEELFKIFKVRLHFLLQDRSRKCFPNSHAYKEDNGRLVIGIDSEAFKAIEYSVSVRNEIDVFMELLDKIPSELKSAFLLVARDFMSLSRINQRKPRTLSGRRRLEPLNVTLARLTGIDKSRDILEELEVALLK